MIAPDSEGTDRSWSGDDGYGFDEGGSSQAGDGAQVEAVVTGSPAESLGLAAGDVVTAVNGSAVTSGGELSTALGHQHIGSTVSVDWTDSWGSSRHGSVALAAGPAA